MKEDLRKKLEYSYVWPSKYASEICWWNMVYIKQSAFRQTKKLWSGKDQAFCDLNAERLEAFQHQVLRYWENTGVKIQLL